MVQAARRMSSSGAFTRERLKLAARRLIAEHGPGGVTVRDILAASEERNGASLNYYFGSKDELIREIIIDLFTTADERWGRGLAQLLERCPSPSVRELVSLIVDLSDTSEHEDIPTTARLVHRFASQDYYDVVSSVLKQFRLCNYDRILAKIVEAAPDIPASVMRQRLVFLTRYIASILALYESVLVQGSARQKTLVSADRNRGNLIDTAVGLITAECVDGLA